MTQFGNRVTQQYHKLIRKTSVQIHSIPACIGARWYIKQHHRLPSLLARRLLCCRSTACSWRRNAISLTRRHCTTHETTMRSVMTAPQHEVLTAVELGVLVSSCTPQHTTTSTYCTHSHCPAAASCRRPDLASGCRRPDAAAVPSLSTSTQHY